MKAAQGRFSSAFSDASMYKFKQYHTINISLTQHAVSHHHVTQPNPLPETSNKLKFQLISTYMYLVLLRPSNIKPNGLVLALMPVPPPWVLASRFRY